MTGKKVREERYHLKKNAIHGGFSEKKSVRIFFASIICIFTANTLCNGSYLALVGPPPLRFQDVSAPNLFLAMKPLDLEMKSLGKTNEPAAVPMPTAKMNESEKSKPILISSTNGIPVIPVVPIEKIDAVNPADSTISPSSASDLLTVTPQMLIEYLKPAQGGTNQAESAVVVPADIGFTPPTKTPAESRASYKVQ